MGYADHKGQLLCPRISFVAISAEAAPCITHRNFDLP
jgi:hypothetical protein